MKVYSFKDIDRVYVVGDCHGEFKKFFNGIKSNLSIKDEDIEPVHPMEASRLERQRILMQEALARYRRPGRMDIPNDWGSVTISDSLKSSFGYSGWSNCLFIVAGDCGFGFNKPKYYETILEKYNKIFAYNNTYVVFVRGNHDDPSYFDGETVNLSNIKAVPDYSVIETKGNNILCVGGAVSIDRTWRKDQEQRVNRFAKSHKRKFYWEDEAPVLKIDEICEATKGREIQCVVSHTAPSFVGPVNHIGIDEWSEKDASIVDDIKQERLVLDKVYETLRDQGSRPKYWAYGHFHTSNIEKRSDTIFRALEEGFKPIEITQDIIMFLLKEKESVKKKKIKTPSLKTLELHEEPMRERGELHGGDALFGRLAPRPYNRIQQIDANELLEMANEDANEQGEGVEEDEAFIEENVGAENNNDLDFLMEGVEAGGDEGDPLEGFAGEDNAPHPVNENELLNYDERIQDYNERVNEIRQRLNGYQVVDGRLRQERNDGNRYEVRPAFYTRITNPADGAFNVVVNADATLTNR